MTAPADDPRAAYEGTGYFAKGGAHLLDPDSAFHRYRIEKVLSLCGALPGVRAVDLGCGWGTMSFALARHARRVVGVDFSAEALEFCRERARMEPHGHLTFVRADARNTGLRTGGWDLVVTADLIEHLDPETTREVYVEAWRLLRPGGRLVVWTPNPGHFLETLRRVGVLRPDPTHIDYKTLSRVVAELEEAGFRIERAGYMESHLPGLRVLERAAQGWLPPLRRRVAVSALRPPSVREGGKRT